MAPFSSRRSSYSRRVQYSIFTGYVLAAIGALVGVVLLVASLIQPSTFSGVRSTAADVVSPVGEAGASARDGGRNFINSVDGYLRAGAKNAKLREEVDLARIRLAEAEAVKAENARLKGLLGISTGDVAPVAVTRLIASTSASSRRFGYVGAGTADGLVPGMPVRNARGVIGRVLEVGRTTSRILLITDSQSVLPVRLADAKRDAVALAEGRGDGRIQVRLVNLGINPLKVGDVMVTSGAGGYYAPGIAVAIISELTDDGGLARPITDPSSAGIVTIEPVAQLPAVEAAAQPADEPLVEAETTDDATSDSGE